MLRVLGNKIAVTPLWDSKMSPSGLIHIPDSAQDRADQGIVKYVGPKVKTLKIGDIIVFGNYDGTAVSIEDEGIVFIMEERAARAVLGISPDYFEDIEIDGLYYKDRRGNYFPANYETAMGIIRDSIQESPLHAGWKIIDHEGNKGLDSEEEDDEEDDADGISFVEKAIDTDIDGIAYDAEVEVDVDLVAGLAELKLKKEIENANG